MARALPRALVARTVALGLAHEPRVLERLARRVPLLVRVRVRVRVRFRVRVRVRVVRVRVRVRA